MMGFGGFGMMGLQERAQLFNGNVVVQSEPAKGTTVHLVVPRQSKLSQLEIHAPLSVANAKVKSSNLIADKA